MLDKHPVQLQGLEREVEGYKDRQANSVVHCDDEDDGNIKTVLATVLQVQSHRPSAITIQRNPQYKHRNS